MMMKLPRANACAAMLVAGLLGILVSVVPALANWTGLNATGQTITFFNTNQCTSIVCVPIAQPVDSTGAALGVSANPFYFMPASGASFAVTGTVSCSNCSGSGVSVPFGGAIGANGTPSGFKDGSGNFQPLLGDVTNGQWVAIKSSTTIPVSGTFWQATQPVSAASLPLPTGAATSANQSTANTSLATIATNSGTQATAANQTTANSFLSTIATNTSAATGSTGSAVPSKASFSGAVSSGNMVGIIQADSSVAINISTATTTQLVALSAGKKIYVTAADVVAAGTGNITFEYGTGTNCGTGTTALTGPYNLTAQAGLSKGSGLGPVWAIPAGNALCALTSAAVQYSGSISYTQF